MSNKKNSDNKSNKKQNTKNMRINEWPRHGIQALWAFITNSHVTGFVTGKIYTGKLKNACVPGLNCYSCPGAVGACPIGSLQAVIGSWNFKMAYYVVGFLIFIGAMVGRLICGFLCPFGLIQDLLNKIPFPKKIRTFKGDKLLRKLKYVIFAVFVILLPLFLVDIMGQGAPYFCKLICPAGTLEGGLPLVLLNKSMRSALDYQIEPDVSAACYFYAMTPLLGIPVCVEHVHFESLQGDVEFLHILEKMGCSAQETENGVLLLPPAGQTDTGTQVPAFHGITVDMSSCSDQAITLAAIAPFADSPTCITGIGHIRFQESDRIHAICTELTRMGIHCEETQDSITIYPGMPHPCTVATYDDHRMAMGFALTGLRAEGIVIDDPVCCRKTFENYFEVLDQVIAKIIEM